jgi:hypothetical protein
MAPFCGSLGELSDNLGGAKMEVKKNKDFFGRLTEFAHSSF